MNMQPGYEWLLKEQGPVMLKEAIALYGVKEVPGPGNSPIVMGWAKETNTTYPGDDVAWCGLFMSVCAKRAGWDYFPNKNALWAKNWAVWGQSVPIERAMLGDVLVFTRDGGGHVGLYVGEDDTHFHVLGGNQSDGVNIMRIEKARCIAVRSAKWKIAQPANVRRVLLSAKGAPISTNEA
jgi:uncharacterized protein (TIGR02594 family)